jgi:predicted alpha/beta superfamily hydrolase
LHRVPSTALQEVRLVRVLMPAAPRDLLILNDGQNVFTRPRTTGSREKWRADEIAPAVAPHLAIVAVDGGRRARDYLPYRDPTTPSAERPGADRYLAFLTDELLPWIAAAYPRLAAPRHLGIGGSSYGGVGALWTALKRPDLFDRLLVESVPLWVGDGRLLAAAATAERWPERVWIGVGTAEAKRPERSARLVDDARTLGRIMRARGASVRLRVDDGATHDERAWAARLPDALGWLSR